jgi:hypothetical protein
MAPAFPISTGRAYLLCYRFHLPVNVSSSRLQITSLFSEIGLMSAPRGLKLTARPNQTQPSDILREADQLGSFLYFRCKS